MDRAEYESINPTAEGYNFLTELVHYGLNFQEDQASGGGAFSLFAGDAAMAIAKPARPTIIEEVGEIVRLEREREVNGLYLSAHPLEEFEVILKYYCTLSCIDYEERLQSLNCGDRTIAGMVVSENNFYISKKGASYAKFTLEDFTGKASIFMFGDQAEKYRHLLQKGKRIIIKGQVAERPYASQKKADERIRFNIYNVASLEDVADSLIQEITLTLPLEDITASFVEDFDEVLQNNKGQSRLIIKVKHPTESEPVTYTYSKHNVAASRDFVNFVEKHQGAQVFEESIEPNDDEEIDTEMPEEVVSSEWQLQVF